MIKATPELGIMRDIYFTDEVAIERKNSLSELSSNYVSKDERFFKEVGRMKDIDNMYILIENESLSNMIEGRYKSQLNPLAFLRKTISLQKWANIYIYFVDRKYIGYMIYELLYSHLISYNIK